MIVRMNKVGKGFQVDERDAVLFAKYKEKFPEGGQVVATFRKAPSSASEAAINLFHALRDRYMVEVGYDKQYAKNELMIRFGVADEIHPGVELPYSGHIVHIYGKAYLRKSILEYTRDEIYNLVEGTIIACHDNGAKIGDLIKDYREADYGSK